MIQHFKSTDSKMSVVLLFFTILLIASCGSIQKKDIADEKLKAEQNEKSLKLLMEKHLNAVSDKDLVALESTMSPEGKMQLILPNSEIINSSEKFIEFHREWFQDTAWTFETQILNVEVGGRIGIAITEIIYREPERNGKPYFNRMIVSYALEKIEGKWYVIKDHASSVEKTQN